MRTQQIRMEETDSQLCCTANAASSTGERGGGGEFTMLLPRESMDWGVLLLDDDIPSLALPGVAMLLLLLPLIGLLPAVMEALFGVRAYMLARDADDAR